jgi:hypothetical protein
VLKTTLTSMQTEPEQLAICAQLGMCVHIYQGRAEDKTEFKNI